jgi:hypothetical protein
LRHTAHDLNRQVCRLTIRGRWIVLLQQPFGRLP